MKIKITELKSVIAKSLSYYGYSNKEISAISPVLLYAQLRDNNQGIVKLTDKGMQRNSEAGEIAKIKETKLSALLDGNKNAGMVVMTEALRLVLKKVKKYGFGIVGINNTFSSTGANGYYAEIIAQAGFIGFVYSGSPAVVAPYGSYQPLLGTNPVAIAVPTTNLPIVLDMATAAIPYYGLIEAKLAKKQIPTNLAYDQAGKITTDPSEAMLGAILAFDKGPKGSGLGLMGEILTGPLVAAGFSGIDVENGWGNLIFAIDPELLTEKQEFLEKASRLSEKIKSAKKNQGVEEIFLPGERSGKLAQERMKQGWLEVDDSLLSAIST